MAAVSLPGVVRPMHQVLPVPWCSHLPLELPSDLTRLELDRGPGLRSTSILGTCEWPMDLLMQDILPIRVSALRFMQHSASCWFSDGRALEDLIVGIISGRTRPWELPPVELIGDVDAIEAPAQQREVPLVWTRDHRRVWCLQAALAKLRQCIPGLEILIPARFQSSSTIQERCRT